MITNQSIGTLTELTAGRSSLGFFATFWNSESDISESESEESIIALDFTLSDSFIMGEVWSWSDLLWNGKYNKTEDDDVLSSAEIT